MVTLPLQLVKSPSSDNKNLRWESWKWIFIYTMHSLQSMEHVGTFSIFFHHLMEINEESYNFDNLRTKRIKNFRWITWEPFKMQKLEWQAALLHLHTILQVSKSLIFWISCNILKLSHSNRWKSVQTLYEDHQWKINRQFRTELLLCS